MSNAPKPSEFLLLIRGSDWYKTLSPEKIQDVVGRFMGWLDDLTEKGKLKAAQPLEMKGKIVSGKNGRVVADGPFAESKEAVGGYFLLTVETFEEALAIAQSCPMLEHGPSMEVRPVADMCPILKSLQPDLAGASV